MKLSENLKIIRKEHNLSQEQLAEKLGVSRQAVSKWESGQSYPEMDKVLLICKLFNYNIDELMNENVKEVNETIQSKININKYVEDFFAFITKTVDLFSSMNIKSKIKCLFEQVGVIGFIFIVFLFIGAIGSEILYNLMFGLSDKVYYVIRNIFSSFYMILAFVLGSVVVLHVFKIRYLDYYEIVKEDSESIEEYEKEDRSNKVLIEKKKEKIIIRDPKHSGSKFLSGILKFVIGCVKFAVAFVSIGFIFSFIGLVTGLTLTFLFVKTGLIFVGGFLGILSCLIINFVVLEISYNFIISKKTHKGRLAILLLISFILIGMSIGSVLMGITQFDYISPVNDIEEVYEFNMMDDLIIEGYNIEYVESNSDKIKIIAKHSKHNKFNIINENSRLLMYFSMEGINSIELIRDSIEDINNKTIKDYHNPEIYLYTSKSNINKLQGKIRKNHEKEQIIQELYAKQKRLEDEIIGLRNEIVEKDNIIDDLKIDLEITYE